MMLESLEVETPIKQETSQGTVNQKTEQEPIEPSKKKPNTSRVDGFKPPDKGRGVLSLDISDTIL